MIRRHSVLCLFHFGSSWTQGSGDLQQLNLIGAEELDKTIRQPGHFQWVSREPLGPPLYLLSFMDPPISLSWSWFMQRLFPFQIAV